MEHAHSEMIKRLGGGSAVAELLSRLTGQPVDRERVYKWQNNGVAREFRVPLARILIGRGECVPVGFLPDGIDASVIQPALLEPDSA